MDWVPLAASAISAAGQASKSAPAGPSKSDQMVSTGIDFSDWTVSTGNSKANGATDNTGLNIPPWLIFAAVGLAAVVAVRWITKKH